MAHAIPQGLHAITPHLVVKGADAAIAFYKEAFGATELSRMPFPDANGEMKIGHAELQIGDSRLFLADEFPEQSAVGPSGPSPVVIHHYVPDVDATFAKAVAAGAIAVLPPENMFWGDRYSKLTDPFGHSWALASHIEDLTPEQIQEKMADMFAHASCDAK